MTFGGMAYLPFRRILKVLGVAIILFVWSVLSWIDCDQAICRIVQVSNQRLLGFASHTVVDLDEYAAYAGGADLYARHRVGKLSFACDRLREQWIARVQQDTDRALEEENSFLLIYLSREGKTLVMDRVATTRRIRQAEFDEWRRSFLSSLEDAKQERTDDRWGNLMLRLFDSAELRAPGYSARYKLDFRYKCD